MSKICNEKSHSLRDDRSEGPNKNTVSRKHRRQQLSTYARSYFQLSCPVLTKNISNMGKEKKAEQAWINRKQVLQKAGTYMLHKFLRTQLCPPSLGLSSLSDSSHLRYYASAQARPYPSRSQLSLPVPHLTHLGPHACE